MFFFRLISILCNIRSTVEVPIVIPVFSLIMKRISDKVASFLASTISLRTLSCSELSFGGVCFILTLGAILSVSLYCFINFSIKLQLTQNLFANLRCDIPPILYVSNIFWRKSKEYGFIFILEEMHGFIFTSVLH